MDPKILLPCALKVETSIAAAGYDGLLLVLHDVKQLQAYKQLKDLVDPINQYVKLNRGVTNAGFGSVIGINEKIVSGGRMVLSFCGPLTRDYDDVRRFSDAAAHAIKIGLNAGVQCPLLVTQPHKMYPKAELCSAMAVLQQLHVPLNVREEGQGGQKVLKLGLLTLHTDPKWLLNVVCALESGCSIARDVGDSDPERMSAPRIVDYLEKVFTDGGGSIKMTVESDQDLLLKHYPMIMHVNRAAGVNPGHPARLVWLEYVPADGGPIDETLLLVGKGVTLDTGGTDLKVNGIMKGMSRDKYGAAAIAGFFKVLELLKPKGLKVVGALSLVRNSVGSHSYTCDEILHCRSGKRIRIGNTDAEGRLAMLDPLTYFREIAPKEINAHAFTLATLTGHAVLAKGMYPTVLDNGPALEARECFSLQQISTDYGQPFDISIYRHEDFDYHQSNEEAADLLQAGDKPTSQTMRGHMTPGAFLQMASGYDEHGTQSEQPLKYSHVDIGHAPGLFPHVTNGAPLTAFAAKYVLPRI